MPPHFTEILPQDFVTVHVIIAFILYINQFLVLVLPSYLCHDVCPIKYDCPINRLIRLTYGIVLIIRVFLAYDIFCSKYFINCYYLLEEKFSKATIRDQVISNNFNFYTKSISYFNKNNRIT